MRIFYKPTRAFFYADVIMLLLSFFVVLDWLPFTTNNPFQKYSWPSLVYSFTWFFSSYLFQRYKPLKKQPYLDSSLKLFYTTSVVFIVNMVLIHIFFKRYSGFVLLTATSAVFAVNYIFLLLYYAYRLAVEYNEVSFKLVEERINAQVKPAPTLDDKSLQQLRSIITKHSGDSALSFLDKSVDLTSGNTMVRIKINVENLQMIPHYQFSTIVQLERLNNIRGINALFSVINEKLSDNGIFVCCFESKSTRKRRILMNYPKYTKYFFYVLDYLYKRVMPKVIVTHSLYYFITNGKDRILSKTEVLGRLYCFGFNVILQKKVGRLTYIVAQRVNQPETVQKRIYGPLITLRRFGKNREPIKVYKMRTMHPYSEYLQGYMYAQNSLKIGGKFYKDTRSAYVL